MKTQTWMNLLAIAGRCWKLIPPMILAHREVTCKGMTCISACIVSCSWHQCTLMYVQHGDQTS